MIVAHGRPFLEREGPSKRCWLVPKSVKNLSDFFKQFENGTFGSATRLTAPGTQFAS
jgi:hypothetical protein